MQDFRVGALTFSFPDDWIVEQYDDWVFYRKQLSRIRSQFKAMDLLALQPAMNRHNQATLWLIEVKDYRHHPRTKQISLDDEVAEKAVCTLAGLLPAALRATISNEQECAQRALRCKELRVVLHLEYPTHRSRLFAPPVTHAHVQASLRRKIKAIDPRTIVVDAANTRSLPWKVT